MEVSREIVENVILDFKKKDIPKQERAKLLKAYREKYKLTQRAFEEITGISKGTLHDWENPEIRDNRYSNEDKKLGSLLTSLENITNPDIKLEKVILKIEREIFRLKDIIQRKNVNKDA